MKKEKQEYLLGSVKNALQLLKSFSLDEQEKKTSSLSKELGLGKSTVSRLLATLASEGFVKKNPNTNAYQLGFSILKLSNVLSSNLGVQKEAILPLKELVAAVNETAHLVMLDNVELVYVYKEESMQPVRIFTQVGGRNPLHCTSSGKVFLAYQSDNFFHSIITSGLEKYTDRTTTNPHQLKREIDAVKEQGFCICVEEFIVGVCSVSSPIFNYKNEMVGAINIVGPLQRMNPLTLDNYIDPVKETALSISKRLGYTVQKNTTFV
jgi:IclR family KDG regulon transcriptional repressor